MAAQVGKVAAHEGDVESIPPAFDHGEDRYEKCPYEEVAGQSITEGVVLVEADIVRQAAYADLVEVGFDDHVCQIHATLHKTVDWVGVTPMSTGN